MDTGEGREPVIESGELTVGVELGADRKGLWSWALYDWANNGFATLITTFVFSTYFAKSVAPSEAVGQELWGNMVAVSGLLIALGGPFLGAIADQAGRRKPWVAVFTLTCVAATILLWFIQPSQTYVLPALLLAGVATVGSEYAVIFYNAMLPAMVPSERIGRWSGWGWGLGYVGGLGALTLGLVALVFTDTPWFGLTTENAENIRAIAFLSAGWYFLFTIPLLLFTPDTPRTDKSLAASARDGLRQIRQSLHMVRRFRHVVRFLVARMIYNDALTTVFAFGGIYAAGAFGMSTQDVIIFGIGLNVTAGLGAISFGWLDDLLGPKRTILLSIAGIALPGMVILLAHDVLMFWIFGLVLGVFIGPIQASSRSWLAHVAPRELRNQMFGLFALSGKVTSFIGPLLVAQATNLTGSQRWGFSTVIVLFLIGGGLMLGVPCVKDAIRLQKEAEGRKQG